MRTRTLSNPKTHALLAERAHSMRFAPTESEAQLWGAIRARRLDVVFKRQVPIGGHIVDFLAPSARLVVEVDGGYHSNRRTADGRRDRALGRWGYTVLRLSAEVVLNDLPGALAQIHAALGWTE
jgi:very-short-patch-repair endonuclease